MSVIPEIQELPVNVGNEVRTRFEIMRNLIPSLRAESLSERKKRLRKLRAWIHKHRPELHAAMHADFQKNPTEVDALEIFHVLSEIRECLTHLDDWAAPKKVDATLAMLGSRSHIRYEPRGICLIIAPWNYPFSLAIGPLVSAIAAGNAAVVKPSELTPNVSRLIKKMVEEVFDDGVAFVLEGDASVSAELLRLPFDHIFFTGSPAIGKIVMKAAAENLASVTLELGGKSPAIVTDSASLNDAATRIAVAKFVNNGQTCVAPDYVLVDAKVARDFVTRLRQKVTDLFSENGDFGKSVSYCRIVNDRHFNRLSKLLQEAIAGGAEPILHGPSEPKSRFFHPVILTKVPEDCLIMDEEIFGPIMPVITYNNLDEAIRLVNSKPKALALYVYTAERSVREKVLAETSSGAVCINDSGVHFLHNQLPFGGINNSGFGKSHGYSGFLTFSHEKSVLIQKRGFTILRLLYPPYTTRSKKIMDWFLKFF